MRQLVLIMENLRLMNKIVIIGAGWYGCYLAYLCKLKNIDYIVYEKCSDIFQKSSSHNQNRLHLGYHYPRDYKTRIDSKAGFEKFTNFFPELSTEIEKNIYSVHKDSLVDFQTYINIFAHEGYDFQVLTDSLSDNFQGSIIVHERYINHDNSKLFFEKANLNIKFNSKVNYNNGQYFLENKLISDPVYNCTYGGLETENSQKNYFNQKFISFIIKKKSNVLPFDAITVMDGPFYSIFPFNKKLDQYTLTHVKYGVVSKKMNQLEIDNLFKLIITEIKIDLPDFDKHFEFSSYFISNKYKPKSNSDMRSTVIFQESNSYTICGGKIDTIFLMDNLINE